MKTQIIQLERHDDAISVKDKMEWRQTPRILLVWPSRGRILNRRLDLIYLKRHATSLGAQLALVTQDSDVKYYADKLDIPIYANTRKAEQSHWRQPRRQRSKRQKKHAKIFYDEVKEKPSIEELRKISHPTTPAWLSHPVTRVIAFTLGVLGVLAIAAIFIPSAKIYLTPKTQTEEISISVTAHPENETVDLSGAVPAQWISVVVEGRSSIPSTGKIKIPLNTASGNVIFTNLTDQIIQVPTGTVVTTAGETPTRFITMDAVDVRPEGASKVVLVQAILPGNVSNTLPDQVVAIEGPLGLNLTVTNPGRISGGSDRSVPAPDEADYQTLKEQLLAELHKSALVEFGYMISEDDYLLSTDLSDFRIVKEKYSPDGVEPSDQLELLLQVEFRALTTSGEDLYNLSMGVLEANLPEGFIALPSSLEINKENSPRLSDGGEFQWKMSVQWQVKAKIDEARTVQLAQWQSPLNITNVLMTNLPIQKPVLVTLTPEWWPRLPILPFRITVIENQ